MNGKVQKKLVELVRSLTNNASVNSVGANYRWYTCADLVKGFDGVTLADIEALFSVPREARQE